jgi:hypothetical protein
MIAKFSKTCFWEILALNQIIGDFLLTKVNRKGPACAGSGATDRPHFMERYLAKAGGPCTSVLTSGESGEEEVEDGTKILQPENPAR